MTAPRVAKGSAVQVLVNVVAASIDGFASSPLGTVDGFLTEGDRAPADRGT